MFGVGEPAESFIVQAAAGNIVLSDPLLAMNSIAPTTPRGPPATPTPLPVQTPGTRSRNKLKQPLLSDLQTTRTFFSLFFF